MQRKIPRPRPAVDRLRRWAIRRGLPAAARAAPRLPRGLLHAAARGCLSGAMAFHPQTMAAIAANLARILGEPPASRRVRRSGRQMLFHFAHHWADLCRFPQLPAERSREVLDHLEGIRHLEGALAAGRGVLLLTAHLGNWELGGMFLRELELPVSVVYVRDEFPEAERLRSRLRRRMGIDEIPISPRGGFETLPVLRALRAGRAVALQGDRDFDDQGWPVEFFGAPAPFPAGPFLLARLTGALVVPCFVVYTSGGRFAIVCRESFGVGGEGDRRGSLRAALERWVGILEEAVRRWPTQWYTFFDFWGGSGEGLGGARRASGEAG